MKFPFRSLGKDLIGFLDKRYILEGFVEYFTKITLYLLYSFLKKKKKKEKRLRVQNIVLRRMELETIV